jgi:hypothetical protein
MKFTKTTTYLLIALAVVALISGVVMFNALSSTPSDQDIITEGDMTASVDEVLFITLASQIETISFDASFFRDPRFMSLVDIRTPIVPEDVGRRDPFANISGIVPTQ